MRHFNLHIIIISCAKTNTIRARNPFQQNKITFSCTYVKLACKACFVAIEVEVERYCQEGPGSMERRGGMRHSQGKMEIALQVPLPRTGRRQRKVRRLEGVHL